MSSRARAIFSYFVAVTVLALFVLGLRYLSRLPFVEEEIQVLTPFQEKQLGIFLDMSRLLVTLATLALGGIGAFVFHRYDGQVLRGGQVFRVVAAWLLCVLSLCCGVLINERLIWMFQSGFFNLTSDRISRMYDAQFWTLVGAILLLADFFYHGLGEQPAQKKVP